MIALIINYSQFQYHKAIILCESFIYANYVNGEYSRTSSKSQTLRTKISCPNYTFNVI